jgi:Uma2 family endonuclease
MAMGGGVDSDLGVWTAADLVGHFGAIVLNRIRHDPLPGRATEEDLLSVNERHHALCELVDGALVEKAMGNYESMLAIALGRFVSDFVAEHDLGVVLGPDGMLRLRTGLVRLPDLSFISWQRIPDRTILEAPIWDVAPDLAVEVLSRSNTREEMGHKLSEYFTAGVRRIWDVEPRSRQILVHIAPDRVQILDETQTLDDGELLPGFSLPLTKLFGAMPA